jgi:hypothetical protein
VVRLVLFCKTNYHKKNEKHVIFVFNKNVKNRDSIQQFTTILSNSRSRKYAFQRDHWKRPLLREN